ncbi:MAG TPA: heme-binding protein [Candidatus Elarobacter sp.]|jgi:hypothetical protein|nr:heme-binding protein [Candidatus Elarobacter sp.]
MELDPRFKFVPIPDTPQTVRLQIAGLAPPTTDLGPLEVMLGPGEAPAKWKGTGFNTIWRPRSDPAQRHDLELNLTDESIDFSRIPGNIPNRGFLQHDINMFGVNYLQQISDANLKAGLHFEPGIWAVVPPTSNPLEPQTVVRMASIPHGTVILAQGTADRYPLAGGPVIPHITITPFVEGQPSVLKPFPLQSTLNPHNPFTIGNLTGITQAMVDNPNSVLVDALANVHPIQTSTLRVSTAPTPTPGGGTANTAFLQGTPSPVPDANANARAAEATAIFWFTEVQTKKGAHEMWLLYTQRVLLNFGGLSWPHVTVGVLVKQ